MNRSATRIAAALLASLALVTLVGGCSGNSSQPDLAAQDRLVHLGNQLAAYHARLTRVQRLAARQRRIAASLATTAKRVHSPEPRATGAAGASATNLCAPTKHSEAKSKRAAERRRERRRKRALYFLNLSCPPAHS